MRKYLPFALPALIFMIIGLYLSSHPCIWYDEIYSILQSRMSLADLIAKSVSDIHPPGYPLLLKMYTYITGSSVWGARSFSFLAIFGAGLLLYFLYSDRKTGTAAALCLWALPGVMFSALEIRMYGTTIFFVTWFFVSAAWLAEKKSFRLLFHIQLALSAFGAMMQLNYAAPYLGAITLGLLALQIYRKEYKNAVYVILSIAGAVLLYSPWLPVVLQQFSAVRSNFWAAPLDVKTIILILDAPFMGYSKSFISTLFILFTSAGMFFSALALNREKAPRRMLTGLAAIVLLPVLACIFLSLLLGRTIIIDRSVLPVCVPLAALLGNAFAALHDRKNLQKLFTLLFGMYFVFHFFCVIDRTRDNGMEELKAFLRSAHPQAELYYDNHHYAAAMAGLMPERHHYVLGKDEKTFDKSIPNMKAAPQVKKSTSSQLFISENLPEKSGFFNTQLPKNAYFYSNYRFFHFNVYKIK